MFTSEHLPLLPAASPFNLLLPWYVTTGLLDGYVRRDSRSAIAIKASALFSVSRADPCFLQSGGGIGIPVRTAWSFAISLAVVSVSHEGSPGKCRRILMC